MQTTKADRDRRVVGEDSTGRGPVDKTQEQCEVGVQSNVNNQTEEYSIVHRAYIGSDTCHYYN